VFTGHRLSTGKIGMSTGQCLSIGISCISTGLCHWLTSIVLYHVHRQNTSVNIRSYMQTYGNCLLTFPFCLYSAWLHVDRTHLLVDRINIHVHMFGLPVHRQYTYVNRTTLPVNRVTSSVHWRRIFFPQTLLYAQKKNLTQREQSGTEPWLACVRSTYIYPPTP
jgi:hypothetical protein